MSMQAASSSRLEDYLHGGGLSGFQPTSATGACLVPLLNALGWRGEARHLAEALPHFADSLDLSDLRMVLANLHYVTVPDARCWQICVLTFCHACLRRMARRRVLCWSATVTR